MICRLHNYFFILLDGNQEIPAHQGNNSAMDLYLSYL